MTSAAEGAATLWIVLAIPSAVFAAWDLARDQPVAPVMRWGWVLAILYTGPVGLVVYLLACREPLPGTHQRFVAPLWKQAVGSTIHCVAGDATGIIFGAVTASLLRFGRAGDVAFEYAAGFAFGLFIFQALFSRIMMGGSYWGAVRRTILPEWLSMNALMGGMIPVSMGIKSARPAAMEPGGVLFWGVMSLAILVGAAVAYPVNVWLVARHLKHGMDTVRVLGRGGSDEEGGQGGGESASPHRGAEDAPGRPPWAETALVTAASVGALALGVGLAWWWGRPS